MGKHQNNEGVIPVWKRYALTISEEIGRAHV